MGQEQRMKRLTLSAKQPVAEGGFSHTRLAKDKGRVLARQILLLDMGLVLSTMKASEKCITQTEIRLLTFFIKSTSSEMTSSAPLLQLLAPPL